MTSKQNIKSLIGLLVSILATRAELISLELTEEKLRFFKVLLTLFFFVVFSMLFLIVVFVGLLYLLWQSPHIVWFFIFSGLFFALGMLGFYIYFKRLMFTHAPFEMSLKVLKEDVQALRDPK